MELKITKERVLRAAKYCSTAEDALKLLFPEVFVEENVKMIRHNEGGRSIWKNSVILINENRNIMAQFANSKEEGQELILKGDYVWTITPKEPDFILTCKPK